ncbi:MAG: hypothetical protein EP343_32220 [Deltaproteobacteria bacterium]|nr:MAG: hypothetical protein EP343_32220 [Deltaproteobacteria bacterium]
MNGSTTQDNSAPPWLSSEHESLILERVESHVLHEFRKTYGDAKPSLAERLQNVWAWGLGSAMAATAALLFFVVQPFAGPSLQSKGGVGLQAISANTTAVRVKPGQTGSVEEANRWKVKLGQETKLAVVNENPKKRRVQLQRGFVHVDVTKGTMEQFVVESDNVQVVVTGTNFTVERQGSWMRVELFHGSVHLRIPGKESVMLKPGEGVRVHVTTGRHKKYDLPPASHRSPQLRFQWLQKKGRLNELYVYSMDLSVSRQVAKDKQVELLRKAADILQGKQRDSQSLKIRKLLSYTKVDNSYNDLNFAERIANCERVFSFDTTYCIKLKEEFVRRYPKTGIQVGTIACQLVDDLTKRAKANPSFRQDDLAKAEKLRTQYSCKTGQ